MDESPDLQLLRRRVLGWSLACEPLDPGLGLDPLGRDLRLSPGPAGLELARVSEIDNLGQALELALTTRLGDDLFDTGFGFDGLNALAEETNSVIARERVRMAVIQVLRRDPRVRSIVDLQLRDSAAGEPLARGTLHVRVVFETGSGERVSAELSGVMTSV